MTHLESERVLAILKAEPQTDEERRFFDKVRIGAAGCWDWTGCTVRGYGRFKETAHKTPQCAHRTMFRWFYGHDLLGALHVDHLCRNRACVNPLHLDAVTQAENNRRAWANGRKRKPKTHCKHGHAIAGDNAGVRSDGKGFYCRICSRAACARYAAGRSVAS